MARIAFIGLGNMGLPMARNLLKAGHTLSGFDLVQATVAQLASEGARAATSARDAASSVDAVISMLPAGRQVEELYLGEEGLLAALPADCLVLECSTIAPSAARRVHRAAAAHGVGSSIGWFQDNHGQQAKQVLGIPPERLVRTAISLGYLDRERHQDRPRKGEGRRPADSLFHFDRW